MMQRLFKMNFRAFSLELLILLVGLLGLAGNATAQWSVVDTELNTKATDINNNLTALNAKFAALNGTITVYLGAGITSTVARYDDQLAALNATLTSATGTGTYGATATGVFPTLYSSACPQAGVIQTQSTGATTAATWAGNTCQMGRQIMAAAYAHSYEYYKKFVEYNVALRGLASTSITNQNIGQLAALQYQVQVIQALQQNEAIIYKTNMDMHRTALDVLKERKRQVDKARTVGDPTSRAVLKAIMLLAVP